MNWKDFPFSSFQVPSAFRHNCIHTHFIIFSFIYFGFDILSYYFFPLRDDCQLQICNCLHVSSIDHEVSPVWRHRTMKFVDYLVAHYYYYSFLDGFHFTLFDGTFKYSVYSVFNWTIITYHQMANVNEQQHNVRGQFSLTKTLPTSIIHLTTSIAVNSNFFRNWPSFFNYTNVKIIILFYMRWPSFV